MTAHASTPGGLDDEPGDDHIAMLERNLRDGDLDALAELFSLSRERLWRTVHFRLDHRLARRVDADDVLQEAYIAAAKRIGHYATLENMSGFLWLRLIVNQTLIDVHRRHLETQSRDADRERSLFAQNQAASSMSIALHLLDHMASPSGQVAKGEVADKLDRVLQTMPDIDREVLALRHFEELSNAETATVLEISERAASNRYTRALVRMKAILQQFPDFFDDVM